MTKGSRGETTSFMEIPRPALSLLLEPSRRHAVRVEVRGAGEVDLAVRAAGVGAVRVGGGSEGEVGGGKEGRRGGLRIGGEFRGICRATAVRPRGLSARKMVIAKKRALLLKLHERSVQRMSELTGGRTYVEAMLAMFAMQKDAEAKGVGYSESLEMQGELQQGLWRECSFGEFARNLVMQPNGVPFLDFTNTPENVQLAAERIERCFESRETSKLVSGMEGMKIETCFESASACEASQLASKVEGRMVIVHMSSEFSTMSIQKAGSKS